MLTSFRYVNFKGEETLSTKTYSEDSSHIEANGEIGVMVQDFYMHLMLAGYDKETIESAFRQHIAENPK